MNNCAVPTCTVKTVPLGPVFLLEAPKVEIPRDLSIRDHLPFSFDRKFAGFAPRGKPLSIKGSEGSAAIGIIPVLKEKPEGWLALPYIPAAGLPVLTAEPRLAFFQIPNISWTWDPPCLCIHPDDVAMTVEIIDQESPRKPTDVEVREFTPEMVNLFLRETQEFKVLFLNGGTCVRVPVSLRFNRSDWAVFHRHVFTRSSAGTVLDTTVIGKKEDVFTIPGHSMDEVTAMWGVGGTRPCAYDGKHLYFKSLRVIEGTKLGRLHPNAARLEGRHLQVKSSYRDYSFDLSEALDGGIIPSSGILHVDPVIKTIYLSSGELAISSFKGPVVLPDGRHVEQPTLLCPHYLVPQYLVSARQAARTYAVPGNVTRYRVRTQEAATASDGDPVGNYYLLADLQNLSARDLKRERAERSARYQRLVDRYGAVLPAGYEKLTDEQIALYFEIQGLVCEGEIILAESHPLLPVGYHASRLLDWIQKAAPHLVMTCPVTRQVYLRRMDGFDELVDIPGFMQAVQTVFGGGPWLLKLILCPKVQAAALISAI